MKKTIRVTTPEVAFDIEVPVGEAMCRALDIMDETGGTVEIL